MEFSNVLKKQGVGFVLTTGGGLTALMAGASYVAIDSIINGNKDDTIAKNIGKGVVAAGTALLAVTVAAGTVMAVDHLNKISKVMSDLENEEYDFVGGINND